jgi:ABC-type polysaccharide/polyol phosphate export permease
VLGLAVRDFREGLSDWPLWHALSIQDIRARYRRSALGPWWLTISLAVTILAMGPLYGSLFNFDAREFIPHLSLGLLFWGFISTQINDYGEAFIGSSHYLRQTRLPLFTFILRVCWRHILLLAHNAVIIPILWVSGLSQITIFSWLWIPAFALVLLNLLWLGLLLAVFCTRYRDMQPVINNMTTLCFFLTPIIWKAEQLSPGRAHMVEWNPFYYFLELLRLPLLGQAPGASLWVTAAGMAVFGWLLAAYLFTRYRNHITYWL